MANKLRACTALADLNVMLSIHISQHKYLKLQVLATLTFSSGLHWHKYQIYTQTTHTREQSHAHTLTHELTNTTLNNEISIS